MLQPWLTLNEIATRLNSLGHEIHFITDEGKTRKLGRLSIHRVESLRSMYSKEIEHIIESVKTDCVVKSVTPLSLVTADWYRSSRNYKKYAYLSYPFYTVSEYLRACIKLDDRDKWQYGRHQLIPSFLWRNVLARYFDGVICQSKRTSQRISAQTGHRIPVHAIPPGIDRSLWVTGENPKAFNSPDTVLLFIGSTKRIRGFQMLLDAFTMLPESGIRLRVMARGAGEGVVQSIKLEVKQRRIEHMIDIRGGWLTSEELRKEIESADVVLLPFILVPSELPVSVMEAICCGTPVIVSDLDGLPEYSGRAGIVIRNGDTKGLAAAIRRIHEDKSILCEMKNACQLQSDKMQTWDTVALAWQRVLTS